MDTRDVIAVVSPMTNKQGYVLQNTARYNGAHTSIAFHLTQQIAVYGFITRTT